MASDVDLEVKKDSVCRYYGKREDATAPDNSKHGIVKRFEFDKRFLPCQESVILAYFAYKYLASESTKIYFDGIPYKSKANGDLPATYPQSIPIDFKNFRHQFGLPTFKRKGSDTTELEFEKELKTVILGIPTTTTTRFTGEDIKTLQLLNTIMQMATNNPDGFDLGQAQAYRDAINKAFKSDNIYVKKTLYVALRHLEKTHRYEIDSDAYIHNLKKIESITDEMKKEDLIKWIDSLNSYEKALIFSSDFKGRNLNKEQIHMLSIITAHMDKYSSEPYMDIFREAKIEYKRMYAKKHLEREVTNKTKNGEVPNEYLSQLKRILLDPSKLDAHLNLDTKEKMPKDRIEEVVNDYVEDKIDRNNLEELAAFIRRCNMTLNTLEGSSNEELREDIKLIVEELKSNLLKTVEKDVEKGSLSDLSKEIYIATKLSSEMESFNTVLKSGLKADNNSLLRYLNYCTVDDNGKRGPKLTDRLKSIKEILKSGEEPDSYIEYMLEDLLSEITPDASYEDTPFDRLSRIEAEVLKEIIIYDVKNKGIRFSDSTKVQGYDIDKGRNAVVKGKFDTESYDTVDICYLLFTHEDIIEELERKYEQDGELNFNFEKIRVKSELLATIGSIKEKQIPMRLTVDEIEFISRSANALEQELETIREEFAEEFDPMDKEKDSPEEKIKSTASKYGQDSSEYRYSDPYVMVIKTGDENTAIYMTYHYDQEGNMFLSPTHIITGVKIDDGRIVVSQEYKEFIKTGKVFTESDKEDVIVRSSEPVIITQTVKGSK